MESLIFLVIRYILSYTLLTGTAMPSITKGEAVLKLQKLADKSLKSMISSYHETERTLFDIDFFVSLFPNETKEHISNALQVLECDSFVNIFRADSIAYTTTLTPKAIRDFEENTLLKRGYKCLKEITSLIR